MAWEFPHQLGGGRLEDLGWIFQVSLGRLSVGRAFIIKTTISAHPTAVQAWVLDLETMRGPGIQHHHCALGEWHLH